MNSPTFLDPSRAASEPIRDLALPIEANGNEAGTTIQLADLKGKAIVLMVFGVDCGTCKHAAGLLSNLRYEYSPDVEFLGICVKPGCRAHLREFAAAADVQLSLSYCTTRELCAALGIPPSTWLFYPTLIFIDREQCLRGLFISGADFFSNLEANLRFALDELVLSGNSERTTLEATR